MSSIVFQPALYYSVTARDDNPGCENSGSGQEFVVDPCYSNGGTVIVECGLCKTVMTLVSATLLDPQPEIP
jgi:hypothetical protein